MRTEVYVRMGTMKRHSSMLLLLISNWCLAQIPGDSLMGHYAFNGDLLDLSGNSNHIVSASGVFTTDRFGQANSAFLFDGVNDSLTIPVPEFMPIQGDYTISLWYRTNSSTVMNLFSSKQTPDDTTGNFEVQLNSNDLYYLTYLKQSWYETFVHWNGTGRNGNAIAEGAPGLRTKGEWCHFVLTRVADTLRIYRDHQLHTLSIDNAYGGILGDAVDLLFSALPHRFAGAIDDLRLHARGLNQQEIDQLWFEGRPFQFIAPRPTDAYVQNSIPLVYWEYNDAVISDSINVEYSVDGGSWQPYADHSHMAYENAFYFDLAPYPIGTTIAFRVSDRADPSIRQDAGAFRVSTYDWVSVQDSLPFTARDGAGLLSHLNKLWLLGGWDPPFHAPNHTHSEVWSSVDGATWNFETTAPWPARHCSAWYSDGTYLYVIGGDPQSGCLTDVWRSANGTDWTLLEDTIPGYSQRNNPNYAHANNELYLFGGEQCGGAGSNEVWRSPDGSTWTQLPDAPWSGRGMQVNSCADDLGRIWMLGGSNEGDRRSFNEVWRTSDGMTWDLVNASAPWAGRYWHTTAWFDQKLWVMGGMATAIEMNDVWYSEDGITWYELKSTTGNWPAGSRHAQSTTVFDDALWYMCGISSNSAWKIVNSTIVLNTAERPGRTNACIVYPNPASSTLTVRSDDHVPIGEYEVHSTSGTLVMKGSIDQATAQLDISRLRPGLYVIRSSSDPRSHRFIKN